VVTELAARQPRWGCVHTGARQSGRHCVGSLPVSPACAGAIWLGISKGAPAPAQRRALACAVNKRKRWWSGEGTRTNISEGYLVLIPRQRRPSVAIATQGELFVTGAREQEFALSCLMSCLMSGRSFLARNLPLECPSIAGTRIDMTRYDAI